MLANYPNRNGHTVVFSGTVEVLSGFVIGNADAWRALVAENEPDDLGLLYVSIVGQKSGTTVRIKTRQQAERIAKEQQP